MTYGKTTALAAVLAAALSAPSFAAGTAQHGAAGGDQNPTQTMQRGSEAGTASGAAGIQNNTTRKATGNDAAGIETNTPRDASGTMQNMGANTQRDWENSRPIDQASFSAEEIIGRDVVNANGEDVGEVNDIVIARDRDDMFLVVGVGGFLGMGEKDVALPVSDLRISSDNVLLMSEKSEDQLKEMPEYKESDYREYQR